MFPYRQQGTPDENVFGTYRSYDPLFRCLDEHLAEPTSHLGLGQLPTLDSYRDDPRFTALLRRMGLEE